MTRVSDFFEKGGRSNSKSAKKQQSGRPSSVGAFCEEFSVMSDVEGILSWMSAEDALIVLSETEIFLWLSFVSEKIP